MNTLYRLIWIPSAIAIIAMTFVFASQPAALPIPGPMKRYSTGDGSIRIDHPGNWKGRERSSHAVETDLQFEPTRNAKMTITIDLQGSLALDILKSTDTQTTRIAGMIPGGEAVADHRMAPLAYLHSAQATQLKREISDYPGFVDGETVKTQVAGREALATSCTWTAPGIFGNRPMTGERITVLSGDHQVSIVYGCLREMEPAVLPVFKQMLDSIEVDGQGGTR